MALPLAQGLVSVRDAHMRCSPGSPAQDAHLFMQCCVQTTTVATAHRAVSKGGGLPTFQTASTAAPVTYLAQPCSPSPKQFPNTSAVELSFWGGFHAALLASAPRGSHITIAALSNHAPIVACESHTQQAAHRPAAASRMVTLLWSTLHPPPLT